MSEEPELTPEIAAKLFAPKKLGQPEPEPEIEGLPPKDKPVSEYTEAERAATHANTKRAMRERERREREQEREQEARLLEEEMRTPAQRHNDTLIEMLGADRKRQANEALIRSLHPPGEEAT